MYLTNSGRNAAVTGWTSAADAISIHSGSPIPTGGNEAVGGTPAYARKTPTWGSPSAGEAAISGSLAFDLPAGTYYWIGSWDASTFLGATPMGDKPLRSVTLAASTDVFTQAGHGLVDTDTVFMTDVLGTGLPTNFSEGVVYYVIGATTDTFQLSLTSGGAAVTTTDSTEVFIQQVVPVVFAGQGTLTIAASGLVVDATVL
jgi:hypothetical protein